MLSQEDCKKVCSTLGALIKATLEDWNNLHNLTTAIYYDLHDIKGSCDVVWEITPVMRYLFELDIDELQLSVCTEFIQELYSTYDYISGIVPYVRDESQVGSFKIVLHGIRCMILFFEHQLYLDSPKDYENFKKFNVL